MFFFFFSSRRRHTRFSRDWSSDVCSSDLWVTSSGHTAYNSDWSIDEENSTKPSLSKITSGNAETFRLERSEERRVGKECRSRRWRYEYKKNAKRMIARN